MATDPILPDLTPEAFAQANRLLTFLVGEANPNYQAVMREVLSPDEFELNVKVLTAKLDEFAIEAPVGAYAGGTGQAKGAVDLAGEDGQRAIRLLKVSGRLLQCGRGRGKCLVLLSAEPIDRKTFALPEKDKKNKPPRPETLPAAVATPPANMTLPPDLADALQALMTRAEQAELRATEAEGRLAAMEEELNQVAQQLRDAMAATWQ